MTELAAFVAAGAHDPFWWLVAAAAGLAVAYTAWAERESE